MRLKIKTPEWGVDFLKPSRYKGAYGGRGSGKSHEFAKNMLIRHVQGKDTRSIGLREIQKSISQSVKFLLERKIETLGVGHYFKVEQSCIRNRYGDGMIMFQGLQNHTADSIKSFEGIDIAWAEEAQSLSQRSIDLLRPTIRKPHSEIWAIWNPDNINDPIDSLLRGSDPPPNSIVKEVNYKDNPWFPDVLREEMEYDRKRDMDKYLHVWEGQYIKLSKATVFRNWTVEEFEAPPEATFRLGADWGYANDPSVLVRCHKVGNKLYIDHEAYEVGCEINDTPDLFMEVPECEKWPIIADSSRPETISYMRKHGFPKIRKAIKGPNSIEEGVRFLKGLDIVIHPRCKHTIDEFTHYKWKVDKDTEEILPVLSDKKNHVIDAVRYGMESLMRVDKQNQKENKKSSFAPVPVMSKF